MFRMLICFCSIYLYSCLAEDTIDINKNEVIIKDEPQKMNTVDLGVYYECLCPDCRSLFLKSLKDVVTKLSSYLNIQLVPYGKAETVEANGTTTFKCQHGPEECYGNMLHACAVSVLRNDTLSALYDICLMTEERKCDDGSVRQCGSSMNLVEKSEEIIKCANSDAGVQLLKKYGEITKVLNPQWVPTVTLNGSADNQDDVQAQLFQNICKLLKDPPNVCEWTFYSVVQV